VAPNTLRKEYHGVASVGPYTLTEILVLG